MAGLVLALPAAFEAAAQQGGLSVETGRLLQVRTLLVMARTYEQDRDPAMADGAYREAVEIAERLEPLDVPLALLWQASFLRRNGRMPEARVAAERALDLFLGTLGPDHPSTAVAFGALGSMEHQVRDFAKAGPHLRAVVDAYARDPDREREPEVWVAAWNLALELKEAFRLTETERLLRLALELKSRLQPTEPWWIARICQELAMNRGAQGEVDDAAALYDRAAAIAETVVGDNGVLLLSILTGRAVSLQRWGKAEASLAAARQALDAHRRAAAPNWATITNLTFMLADGAVAMGKRAEADDYLSAVLQEYDRDPSRVETRYAAIAAVRLAESLRAARRFAEAEAMARRVVALRLQTQPVDQRDVARAHHALGLILFGQKKVSEGAAEVRRAIDTMRHAEGAPPIELAVMYQWLSDSYFDAGYYGDAEEPALQAVDLLSKQGSATELTIAQVRLSIVYRYQERLAEAEALAREALAVREKAGADDALVADALFHVAAALRWQRRYAEAEPLLRRSLALREKAYGKEHRLVLADMNALALSVQGLGRATEAEAIFRETLAGREKVLGAEDEDVAETLVCLVWNLRRQGRFAEAAAIADRPLAIYRKALGADHPGVVRALLPLATIRQERGEFEEADRLLHEALRIRQRVYGADSERAAESYADLVGLAAARRQFEEGAGYAEKMLAIVEGLHGRDDPRIVAALTTVASFQILSGDLDRPEATLKRVLAISERACGAQSVAAGYAALNLAYLYRLRGRFGDVEAYYDRPLRIFETVLGPENPAVADALLWRADFEIATGQAAAAEASYDRALSIYASAFGEDSPARAAALARKAIFLIQLGRTAEAERLLKDSIALLRKGAGRETPALAMALANLGLLYEGLGRRSEAKDFQAQATAMLGRLYGPKRIPPVLFSPLLMPPPQEI